MPGYELYGDEERAAILEWFDSNNGVMFAHGFDGIRKGVYKVREFEQAVAARINSSHAQAVSSGSAALLVALRALGIRPGDEVITSAFTFVATVEAIIEAGAVPVIAEVDESLNLDPADVERRISVRTRGLIPVHMAGAPADMGKLLSVAKDHGIWVLEDAAQAFGGTYFGRNLGTLGDAGTFSFDFAKNITTGEGGMIVTDQADLFEQARAYHDHGHEYNPSFPRGEDTRSLPGFNFRLTEVQAVLGLVQLTKLDEILVAQRAHKAAIKDGIKDCGLEFRRLNDPEGDIGDTVIFFLPTPEVATHFAAELGALQLGTKNLPDALIWHFAGTWRHLFGEFPELHNCDRLWPKTDSLLRRAIALPISVKMGEEDIDRIVSAVCEIAKRV